MTKHCNLLLVFIILFSFNCNGEDIESAFSVIDQLNNSENSPEILPSTYEEPNIEDIEDSLTGKQGSTSVKEYNNQLPAQNEGEIKNSENINESKSATIYQDTKSAKITALNKITAKSQAIIMKIGEASFFGNIEIKIHRCLKSNDPYKPENKILLSITENKVDEDQLLLYQGWMMSSNIAAGTFEHAVYEVFAEECI